MSVQDQPQNLSTRQGSLHQASPHEVAGFGVAMALAGLYFMLGSYDLLNNAFGSDNAELSYG